SLRLAVSGLHEIHRFPHRGIVSEQTEARGHYKLMTITRHVEGESKMATAYHARISGFPFAHLMPQVSVGFFIPAA
ncbi:MAG: hypothetical protein ACJ8LG_22200, partial [Massilia sp.]